MPLDRTYDLAIVGAGAAGLSVAHAAAKLGARTALIERGRMGGDCLHVGCVPSKALLAAAHAARTGRRAGRLGIRFAPPEIDWPAVRAHVRGAIDTIAPVDSAERYRGLGAAVIEGEARFVSRHALSVGGATIEARRIVIATGSRPALPDIPGLPEARPLTNETLFDLADPPAHLAILGGGAIGLEMAQAHAALGCRVTLIDRGTIGGGLDPIQADTLRTILRAEGVELRENVTVTHVSPKRRLTLSDGTTLEPSHLLVAAGRTPTVSPLAPETIGLAVTPHGIATDRGLRSLSHRHVYACGDVADPVGIGPCHQTHAAAMHAGIVIRHALFHLPARLGRHPVPRVLCTDPEWAVAGMTEAQAAAAGHAPRILRVPMTANDRAVAEADTAGSAVLVLSARGALLGASLLHAHAGEAIGFWAQALGRRIPLSALAATVLPYPTRAEAARRAAANHLAERLFAPVPRRVVRLLRRLP